jgi:DNA-binding response OmpR family regulator
MKKRTILIIDDESVVTKLFSFYLDKKYNVLEAHDGEEGLKIINKSHPDLLILDINMPKIGGIEVYNKICVGTGKPPFPVILLTVREELGPFFRDLDVDGFIIKPCEINSVLREIDAIMNKRYGLVENTSLLPKSVCRKILIVEDNAADLEKIAVVFLNAGYTVDYAKSGMQTIEKMITDVLPDIILIKLDLADISGDLVCLKLKQMPRTMDIPFVLYSIPGDRLENVTVKKICEIIKADFIDTGESAALLKAVEEKLKLKFR